jgi:proton glutamate symport protein
MLFALMLASKGMAAVPRVALVILAGTLGSFNIPVEGIAVLLGIDHILDMGRTTVNLIGNCVATVVVSRWEGAFDYQKMDAYMEELKNGAQDEEPAKPRELIALIAKNKTQNLSSMFD